MFRYRGVSEIPAMRLARWKKSELGDVESLQFRAHGLRKIRVGPGQCLSYECVRRNRHRLAAFDNNNAKQSTAFRSDSTALADDCIGIVASLIQKTIDAWLFKKDERIAPLARI